MESSRQVARDVDAVQRRGTVVVAGVIVVLLVARVGAGSGTGLPRSGWSMLVVALVVVGLVGLQLAVVRRRVATVVAQRALWSVMAVAVLFWTLDAALLLPRAMALDFQLTWSQNVTSLVLGAYLVLPRRGARRAVLAVGVAAGLTMVVASATIGGMPEAWQGTVSVLVVVALADALAGSVAVLRHHEARARTAALLAYADDLTGLPNRRGALQQLELLTPGTAMALVDLDDFKLVNDRRGHDVGDAVLAAVGAALAGAVRGDDVAARWGGEEFLVVRSGPSSTGPAAELAERLRAAVAASGAPVPVSASVGVAVARGGEAWEDVFRRADAALYEAKAAGRDRVVVADAPARVGRPSDGASGR